MDLKRSKVNMLRSFSYLLMKNTLIAAVKNQWYCRKKNLKDLKEKVTLWFITKNIVDLHSIEQELSMFMNISAETWKLSLMTNSELLIATRLTLSPSISWTFLASNSWYSSLGWMRLSVCTTESSLRSKRKVYNYIDVNFWN